MNQLRSRERKLVSIVYLTIDRYPSCIDNLNKNLAKCGVSHSDIEILWCDNGSAQEDVLRGMRANELVTYARVNKENEGIARSLNQLILRSNGQYIVQLGNDYEMPNNWLDEMIRYASDVIKAGMVGIPWCPGHRGPLTDVLAISSPSKKVHLATYDLPLFGVKLKTRQMLDRVGAFDERLHPYGLEDSDYHRRAQLAGFVNFYIPDLVSKHLGEDSGKKTDYRAMKDFSLKCNGPYFVTKDYARFGYYVPWPAMTEGYAR